MISGTYQTDFVSNSLFIVFNGNYPWCRNIIYIGLVFMWRYLPIFVILVFLFTFFNGFDKKKKHKKITTPINCFLQLNLLTISVLNRACLNIDFRNFFKVLFTIWWIKVFYVCKDEYTQRSWGRYRKSIIKRCLFSLKIFRIKFAIYGNKIFFNSATL